MIVGIKAILDKQPTSLGKTFRASGPFFGRVWALSILIDLGLLVVAGIIAGPIAYMYSQQLVMRANILLVLGVLVLLPVVIVGLLIGLLGPMFVVIYDMKINESFKSSFELAQKTWILLIGFGITLFVVDLPALFLGSFMVESQRGLEVLIPIIIVYLLAQSLFMVFQQTVWVLVFKELIQPQKMEEEVVVPAPEIVS
jgi:hypothetical protein